MDFRVLGPIEVLDGGRRLALGGRKPRALLAMLLLRANTVVSRDLLIDGLWGERPPASADHTLDGYVSGLRKLLGPDRLQRRAPGYVLTVREGELDLDRFERLVAEGRYRNALDVWRGPALADVLYEPFAAREAEQLEERRLVTLERRMEADLADGRSAELVPELEALLRVHPLRERLVGQLMLALYRAGRQAEALDAFRRARAKLADELGLEPSPELRELERRILVHDEALAAPSKSKAAILRPHRLSGRIVALAVVGAVAALGIGLGVALGTGSGSASGVGAAAGDALIALGKQGATGLPGAVAAVSADTTSLWLAEPDTNAVLRVDRRTRQVIDRVPLPANPNAVAVAGGSAWVGTGTKLFRINPRTEAVVQTVDLGGASASALVAGAGGLWVADAADGALIDVNPVSGIVRRTVTVNGHPTALAIGAGAIWAADYTAGTVGDVDPSSGRTVATIHVGNGPAALAIGSNAVWVANVLDSTVSRIDPWTGSIAATIPVESGPGSLAATADGIWVGNEYSQTISRIDPARNAVADTRQIGGGPTALAAVDGTLFVATRPLAGHRGGTLRLLTSYRFPLDPQLNYDVAPFLAGALTNPGLVTLAHTGGAGGEQLVPDLALALPSPADEGSTYTFRLRPGIRYSDGRALRASDFRRALERLFRLRSPEASFFSGIVGASGCLSPSATTCDLADGVVTDDRAGIVTFRLVAPDPDFLLKLTIGAFTAPVPPGTPFHDTGFRGVPGTGPYEVAHADAHGIRYERNPYFREWSHAAAPDGNPDAIVWRFGMSHADEIRAVEAGRADWTQDAVPAGQLPLVQRRYAARVHTTGPQDDTDFFQLNTTVAPFDDLRVRRALNFALDRHAIVQAYGGPEAATPTCQILPPALAGYRRYCPYTEHVSPTGVWAGPALAEARRLVAASHTLGDVVTVWGPSDDAIIRPEVVRLTAAALRGLGYRVRTRLITHDELSRLPPSAYRAIQMFPTDWTADYPSALDFVQPWLTCHGAGDHGWFCDPAIDRRMVLAETLELTNPRRAAAEWAELDHELVDRAVWVPLVNPQLRDFVSARVRNYQSNPYLGFVADQVWLH